MTTTPILHVDMDAFFAAVELVRHPELRGKPVLVGGRGARGVVAAASYEARAFGVHSAMPSLRARRLCPEAVFLPGDHAYYGQVSRRVMGLFHRFTPLVEPLSLDEAFLDVGGAERLHGSPTEVALAIRKTILEEEHLTCSVGVAPNKFLSKLASESAKPRAGRQGPVFGSGICVVEVGGVEEFLDPLPVEAVWGVGPRTLERMHSLGVQTVAQLRGLPEGTLVASVGRAAGRQLWRLARGIDDRAVEPGQTVKSIGHEETFAVDLERSEDLHRELARMVDAVAHRLRDAGVAGRTVTVKLRYGDFTTVTRSQTRAAATDLATEILETATDLLGLLDPSPGVRLLGVSVSGLQDGNVRQLRFDEVTTAGWRAAEETVDRIRHRFGAGSIGPGSIVGPDGLRPKRPGQQKWGPDSDWQEEPAGSEPGS